MGTEVEVGDVKQFQHDSGSDDENVFLVFNSKAGGADEVRQVVRRLVDDRRCGFDEVNGPAQSTSVIEDAVRAGARRIIVAGGDGSISLAANTLARVNSNVELAIVPLGTGNDLARSLDLPRNDPQTALESAMTGPARPIDLVRIGNGEDGLLVNACSAGFAGKVCAAIDTEAKQRWGTFAYWVTAVAMLADLPTYRVEVTLDDRSFESDVHCLVVANGRYIGGGFPIAAAAMLDDGFMNVTVVPEQLAADLLSAGLAFMRGEPEGGESLLCNKSRRVKIRSDPPMPFSVDGEMKERLLAKFEVVPAALHVVVGPKPVAITPSPDRE